jgi:plasmid stabilization system protein ParE
MIPLRWTRRGAQDIVRIYNWLFDEASPKIAEAQKSLLLDALLQLQRFPASGTLASPSPCRKLFVAGTPYWIYHRLRNNALEVLAIRHAAQKPLKRFPSP